MASPRTFDVAGVNPIPLSAVAVSGNVTVVGQTSGGYVSLTPKATATPKSSTINVPVGDTRANNFTVPLDATGELSAVFKGAPGSKAHVLADITGYFVEGDGHGTYDTIAPARVLDSRTGDGRHLQPHDRRADGGRLCLDHAHRGRYTGHVDDQLPARRHASKRRDRPAQRRRRAGDRVQSGHRQEDPHDRGRDGLLPIPGRRRRASRGAGEARCYTPAVPCQ